MGTEEICAWISSILASQSVHQTQRIRADQTVHEQKTQEPTAPRNPPATTVRSCRSAFVTQCQHSLVRVKPFEQDQRDFSTASSGSMSRPLVSVRPITDAEASVVERALAVAAVDELASTLAVTVRSLQVVGRCSCGCASIDFRIPTRGQIARIVADAVAEASDGEPLSFIIWALDNELSGLEVLSYSGNPAPLPVLASISSYKRSGSDDIGRR